LETTREWLEGLPWSLPLASFDRLSLQQKLIEIGKDTSAGS
jgi:hypothetical protein